MTKEQAHQWLETTERQFAEFRLKAMLLVRYGEELLAALRSQRNIGSALDNFRAALSEMKK